MKKAFHLIPLVFSLFLSGCGNQIQAKKVIALEKLKDSVQSLKHEETRSSLLETIAFFEYSATLDSYFANSYGVAIFPHNTKGAVGVGGGHGKGWVFENRRMVGMSTMSQITIGLQVGGQVYRQIIFFEDKESFDQFTSGNFAFSAHASAVTITAGANASASTTGGKSAGSGKHQTKTQYTSGVAIFTHAKGGLMYEASVGGQKFGYKDIE